MRSQLRLYAVREGRIDAFVDAWLAGVPHRALEQLFVDRLIGPLDPAAG